MSGRCPFALQGGKGIERHIRWFLNFILTDTYRVAMNKEHYM